MKSTLPLAEIPGLRRIETFEKDEMQSLCMELTHAVYPHDQIYGQYCTLEEYIDCPPDEVIDYLAEGRNLEEWTYSMRDFEPTDDPDVLVSYDRIGGKPALAAVVDDFYRRVLADELLAPLFAATLDTWWSATP